jgi:serine/threonine protein kinase
VYTIENLNSRQQRSLLQEVAMLEGLVHPNVVGYFGHDLSVEGEIRAYMEFCPLTLRDVLDKRRGNDNTARTPRADMALQPPVVGGYAAQVAAALEYLHNLPESIVHRDLKSENIFAVPTTGAGPTTVDYDGVLPMDVPLVLKLGDFGEAVRGDLRKGTFFERLRKNSAGGGDDDTSTQHDTSSPSPVTRSPSRGGPPALSLNVGTPEFMAPEMVAADRKAASAGGSYDEKVDIWSFGMVLYELLTLDIPYRRGASSGTAVSRFELPKLVAAGVRPTLADDGLPRSADPLVKLFQKCTMLRSTDRPSARDLVKRLRRINRSFETAGKAKAEAAEEAEAPPKLERRASGTFDLARIARQMSGAKAGPTKLKTVSRGD